MCQFRNRVARPAVQGTYRATTSGFDLELRVDVDGVRPTRRVSGDFFTRTGATVSYFGSFVVDAVTVTTTASEIKVEGQGTFTWQAANPFVRLTIPRPSLFQPRKPATLVFLNAAGVSGATYSCAFSYITRFFSSREPRGGQDSADRGAAVRR